MPVSSGLNPTSPMSGQTSSLVGSVTTGMTNAVISHFSKPTSKLAQPQTYSSVEIGQLRTELDELLAVECPWCGERILKTIDEPFVDMARYEATFSSWL